MHFSNKILLTVILNAYFISSIYSQETDPTNQLIDQTDFTQDQASDFTKYLGIQSEFKSNINTVSKEDMMLLPFLNHEQIISFFTYKDKFGNFISMFELQAIPLWNMDVIRKIMRLYTVRNNTKKVSMPFEHRDKGYEQIWARIGRSGTSASSDYTFQRGLKETLVYRNLKFNDLYAGVSLEKDMGEKNILDFSSFFFQKEHLSVFKKVVVGDYLIAMGQGLVHWNGYAFGKNAQILSIFRQAPSIKPHTGTEENRFFRGAALEIEKRNRSMVLFFSNKKIDANTYADSIHSTKWVTSLLLSGLHRDEHELEDKHSLKVVSSGIILQQQFKKGHISFNGIYHHFDIPIQKRNLPYNTFSLKGNQWFNGSGSFVYELKNGTVFGEVGMDRNKATGAIVGLLKSINRYTDIGVQWRKISPSYNSFSSNIIADQSNANNENGLYIGINMKINNKLSIETFIDQYKHPFPIYSADGPQRGLISVIQLTYMPSKKAEIYLKMTEKRSNQNQKIDPSPMHIQHSNVAHQTRMHASVMLNDAVELRIRNEVLAKTDELKNLHLGWLTYIECILHPLLQPYSISYRSTFYNTDNYESAIYAMERDLPQYYSMSSFFNRGSSNYFLIQYTFNHAVSFSAKWSIEKNFYPAHTISSNFETSIHTSWRTQLTIKF